MASAETLGKISLKLCRDAQHEHFQSVDLSNMFPRQPDFGWYVSLKMYLLVQFLYLNIHFLETRFVYELVLSMWSKNVIKPSHYSLLISSSIGLIKRRDGQT